MRATSNSLPIVRAARPADLDALVNLDLAAFSDGYESPLNPETLKEVRQKFADRLELLGQWARVLEAPGGGLAGMSLAFPISASLAELTELSYQGYDMTDTEVIRSMIDDDGTTCWGLTLAVAPNAGIMSGMPFLAADMRSLKAAHGIQRTYFFSRLPGLAGWAARQSPGVNVTELPRAQQATLAAQYLNTTVHRGGTARIADPLLAMYVDSGAVPLKLFSRWGAVRPVRGFIDMPSLGYHVLCEHSSRGSR
jgi:hypothetical protein